MVVKVAVFETFLIFTNFVKEVENENKIVKANIKDHLTTYVPFWLVGGMEARALERSETWRGLEIGQNTGM